MKRVSLWHDVVPDQRRFEVLKGSITTDIVVIGGGIAGLTAAWELVKAGKKVVLLEKNHLATGDTGLTTGFLTRVPDTSLVDMKERYGLDFVKSFFAATAYAQNQIFKRIKENNIDCDFRSVNSHYCSYRPNDEVLRGQWEIVRVAQAHAQWEPNSDPGKHYAEAIRYENEGSFHVRKYCVALAELLVKKGVKIFEESEAVSVEVGKEVVVTTPEGSVTATKVCVAIGRPGSLLPELAPLVESYLSYVVAVKYETPPLDYDLYWDTFDPYFYYRRVDERTVIVGGADIAEKNVATQKPFEKICRFVDEYLPGRNEITHEWSGSIFHTSDNLPYAFEHPHYKGKVFVAGGFGGNGLVCGSLCGTVIAQAAAGKISEYQTLLGLERTGVVISAPVKRATIAITKKSFVAFGTVSEFKGIKPVCKIIEGRQIVMFKLGEKFHALDNICSHAGGSLCDGNFDGKVVECPLHGAKFDVTDGGVKGPPATRKQLVYPVRVTGEHIEVEVPTGAVQTPSTVGASMAKKTYWGTMAKFSLVALAFFALEFVAQYYWLSSGDMRSSVIRSTAFTGATLLGLALFTSSLFKWVPRLAIHWRIRRYLGVASLLFVLMHATAIYQFYYNWDVASAYFSFNPFTNPIVFGSIALPILFVMAVTSTDGWMRRLTPKIWKNIHRFVYVAYMAAILHFVLINPTLLKNPVGYLLLGVTAATVFGEIFWLFKVSAQRKFKNMGFYVGLLLLLASGILGYFAIKQLIS